MALGIGAVLAGAGILNSLLKSQEYYPIAEAPSRTSIYADAVGSGLSGFLGGQQLGGGAGGILGSLLGGGGGGGGGDILGQLLAGQQQPQGGPTGLGMFAGQPQQQPQDPLQQLALLQQVGGLGGQPSIRTPGINPSGAY